MLLLFLRIIIMTVFSDKFYCPRFGNYVHRAGVGDAAIVSAQAPGFQFTMAIYHKK